MQVVLEKLALYLQETLGATVTPVPWRDQRLPHFLKDAYLFSEIDLLGSRCLLVLDSSPTELAPAALRKHIGLVQTRWEAEVIYVRPRLTAYNRKRLVEQKVPFIVPGNQMYLPTLGIDFREHFRRLRSAPAPLSPSAQVLLVHALLRAGQDVLTPKETAARLGYSAMTMTRAFDTIEATSLGEVSTSGKERRLRFEVRRQDTWTKAQPFLRSPVKQRICIERIAAASRGPHAGLSALAEYTMLAPPECATHALSREDWRSLRQQHEVIEVPRQDPEALEIEIWSYSPAQFADGGRVDPLSLYLSLRDSDDERVAASLEELMEQVKW
jgi:hypothetical protein